VLAAEPLFRLKNCPSDQPVARRVDRANAWRRWWGTDTRRGRSLAALGAARIRKTSFRTSLSAAERDEDAETRRPPRRAMQRVISDNHPHVVVDANGDGVEVPRQYVRDGKIVLNRAGPRRPSFA
jgi:hypothetical protein